LFFFDIRAWFCFSFLNLFFLLSAVFSPHAWLSWSIFHCPCVIHFIFPVRFFIIRLFLLSSSCFGAFFHTRSILDLVL
jgi:hypothetical protein